MRNSQFYRALAFNLLTLSLIKSDPSWIIYSKDQIYADCFFINLHYFCREIERDNAITSCKNGRPWSFEMLRALNATTNNLIDWSLPLNLIERYATYLNDHRNTFLAELTICNCTLRWVGRECDYEITAQSTDPGKVLVTQNVPSNKNFSETLTRLVDDIICPGADLFLEWRHICDGVTQCQNGADELHCHLLEFHQCEENEFQCRNGMCIPIEFAFDAMPDCLDSSDEQETEALNQQYYSCKGSSSFNCGDRQCRKDQFSCGNGECATWSSVLREGKGCSNHRQAAYLCETMDYIKSLSDEFHGLCRETASDLPSLTNKSDCLESFAHLLRIRHDASAREIALINIKNRCALLIVYSSRNAFFPGLHIVYNRSNIEAFYSKPKNLQKLAPRTPDLYYFSGGIQCGEAQLNTSIKIWFEHRQMEELASYPFFPLSHLLCQELLNRSFNEIQANNTHYRCQNTSDRISLRRINDGYIDCLYGDDERNPLYPMVELFRYRCQTVASPFQYVSYSKLGNGVDDCLDGSDELSQELRWSNFKCDLNDGYECWVFQGGRFNDDRIRDVRLHFHRYCDSVWDMTDGHDEKNCSTWICDLGLYKCNRTGQCIDRKNFCDGEFDCDDGEDEVNCPPRKVSWDLESLCDNRTEYFCLTDLFAKNQSLHRPCISWDQVGDGHIDCIGARDERNVFSCPVDHRMIGDRFLCGDRTQCIDYLAICNGMKDCSDGTDETVCYWNTGYCPIGQFSCADHNGCKSIRCNADITCKDKSHRFWCPNSTEDNLQYRSRKDRPVTDNKDRCYSQSNSQVKLIKASLPIDQQVGYQTNDFPIAYRYCNMGFYLKSASHGALSCFCPLSFYGDRCQYNRRRVTIRSRFDRYHRLDLPVIINVLFMLLFNGSEVIDHRFITDEAKEFSSKNDLYLIYPRPKPSGVYTVRIEAYHSTEFLHFWEYPISPLDFLPVFRMSKVLRFPDRSLPWLCSSNPCQNNGTCYQAEKNTFLCLCSHHWKGKFCEIRMNEVRCAKHSLARTETVCVCPHGYMEPHCFIENVKCQQLECSSNETCVPRSDLPLYRHVCICNTSDCKSDRPIIVFDRDQPNQSPFLVQLLQLTGNYPTIRHQILIRPSTSFPLMKTIKTRDGRVNIGALPDIGLLFSFESYEKSVKESTLHLLFINCSDTIRNFTIDLDFQPQKCHVLSANERHSVSLFPQFCHNSTYGSCFISDGYLCYCDYPKKNQSNCLSYQRRYTTCNYCGNEGHCVQGDLTNRTDFVCVCPKCVTGILCQFSLSRFSISLEYLIEKADWGRGHFLVPLLLFIIGMSLNSLSIITFAQGKLRTSGVALHLLATSLCSLLVLTLLFIRVTYLYLVRRIRISDEINIAMCKSLPILTYTLYYISLWLMAMVTVERALGAMQYSRWSSLQEPRKAIALVFLIGLIVVGSNFILINQYKLVDHPDYSFPWCIREIPSNQQFWTPLLAFVHQALPFLVNIVAAIMIIIAVTRSKMHVQQKTKYNVLIDQTRKRFDLLLGPIACFLAQLPEIIILFLNTCDYDTSVWFSHITLSSYYVSFIPQMSIFFLYITPSKHYRDIFLKYTLFGKYISSTLETLVVRFKR